MTERIIYELDDDIKARWNSRIKLTRDRIILRPIEYVNRATNELGLTIEDLRFSVSTCISQIRDKAWLYYIEDEERFHRQIIVDLISQEQLPRQMLDVSINENLEGIVMLSREDEDFTQKIAQVFGDYSGRIMPFIYMLSLSTTNSRRSRSGTTFEEIIYYIMRAFEFPFQNQSQVGITSFVTAGLGKRVDMIVPSRDAYIRNRNRCHVVTMKTTLRERWQEVVEEMSRTGIPHIYLLTLDESLTQSTLVTLANHNITVVTYDYIDQQFPNLDNVKSFENYFYNEITYLLNHPI